MTQPRLYLAGPYSQGDTALNVRTIIQAAETATSMGWIPFVPHLIHLWHLISPHTIDFWYAYDIEWLSACQALLRLPGASQGADMEVEAAIRDGLPVFEGVDNLIEAKVFLEHEEVLRGIFGDKRKPKVMPRYRKH